MSERVVIVGGGHAGATLAAALRQKGFAGDVTLLSAEPHHPYHRPPLSKGVLTGGAEAAERILLRPPRFYTENAIDLRTSARATEIDRGSRTLALASGETLAYDRLVLATGTRARIPPIPGIDREGVLSLRTLADAETIGARIVPGARLVVLGAGYIGLEVAAVAGERGVDVTVVERADRPLARVASPIVSEWVRERHASRGVRILLGATAERIEGDPAVTGVVLSDGTRLPADTVLVGIGAEPVTELAAAANLPVEDGIVVDEAFRTGDPAVFAIGDAASYRCAFTAMPRRLESVQNAQDQAKVVASVLAGEAVPYDAVPWFWSDQGPDKLQSAGIPDPSDDLEVTGDVEAGRFTVLHRRDGVIVASESVNDARGHMLSRRWIRDRARVAR